MSRNQQKGTSFETSIAQGLAATLGDDRIERRARAGVKDRGDIAGVRLGAHRVVIECKNEATGKVLKLPGWTQEAHDEAVNDGALVGVVIHKRAGTTKPGEQWCSMTVSDFVMILRAGQVGWRV